MQILDQGSGDGWQEAERKWIAHYRPSGVLTNETDGGDGILGYKFSAEETERRRQSKLGTKHSPETLAKIGAASRGRQFSDAEKERRRTFMLSMQVLHPEIHLKGALSHIGMKRSLETRRKISVKALLRPPISDETKKKISESLKATFANKRAVRRMNEQIRNR